MGCPISYQLSIINYRYITSSFTLSFSFFSLLLSKLFHLQFPNQINSISFHNLFNIQLQDLYCTLSYNNKLFLPLSLLSFSLSMPVPCNRAALNFFSLSFFSFSSIHNLSTPSNFSHFSSNPLSLSLFLFLFDLLTVLYKTIAKSNLANRSQIIFQTRSH